MILRTKLKISGCQILVDVDDKIPLLQAEVTALGVEEFIRMCMRKAYADIPEIYIDIQTQDQAILQEVHKAASNYFDGLVTGKFIVMPPIGTIIPNETPINGVEP